MSNLIITAEDTYRSFLRGIRQSSLSVIKPKYWNPFINEVQLQWVKSKLPMIEFTQKRIDDLERLRVVTDGSSLAGAFMPLTGTGLGVFQIPSQYTQESQGILLASNNYPLYLHGLNASFRKCVPTSKPQIDPGIIDLTCSEWIPAKIRKSDKTVMLAGNPYRLPTKDRLYFERIKGEIRLIGGSNENQLRLEYFRYPQTINYGTGTLDPEFAPSQNQEIVDSAVRIYLERTMAPRYKSFLQEEMIKSQGQ